MKEEIIENRKTDKNPYSYNGEVLDLPPHLTPQKKDGSKSQLTETEGNTSENPHRKKVYTYSYGR